MEEVLRWFCLPRSGCRASISGGPVSSPLLAPPLISISLPGEGERRSPPSSCCFLLFFSYFKELVGKEVTVELKNDLAIRGTLHSVDQYLNIKLENTRVVDQDKYPHMLSVRNCFIRGSVVRYVLLPQDGVDIDILHDATRREARGG
uniref:Sm domain-containing protein n=1 Tax=Oryza meridionalis TaxID=40149 RepID=A0A0E0EI09_9ORYZ